MNFYVFKQIGGINVNRVRFVVKLNLTLL